MPKIVACGSRRNAYDDFCTAIRTSAANEFPFLLVDSEAPVSASHKNQPWAHLKKQDGWTKLSDVLDTQAHLMVQVMETWFLADVAELETFFGKDFKSAQLPKSKNIESLSKKDIIQSLKKASEKTQKGEYGKGAHSFDILENIDPQKVTDASKWANRLFEVLRKEIG